jgi:hypothetical protein
MSVDRTTPPRRVPILTEVVLLSDPEAIDIPIDGLDPVDTPPVPPAVAAVPPQLPGIVEERLVEDVWADLQRQVDLMLEYRLRETLAPILSRATESVLREARQQLASTLRDMVARAVAQELARHRGR